MAEQESTYVVDDTSKPFVGEWQTLVSTTNWDKGRIISQWRAELIEQDAEITEYSDEAWARLVGGVTAQHVGRLRRVFERFGETHGDYEGLYWSHFHAAIDWTDAELWLEGGVQEKWSVSVMRRKRWETLGEVEADRPLDHEIVAGEVDEDFETTGTETVGEAGLVQETVERVQSDATPQKQTQSEDIHDADTSGESFTDGDSDSVESPAPVRPFENLADMPDDVQNAFESFKLAILHHKMDGWQDVGCDDVLAALVALKELALAPSEAV